MTEQDKEYYDALLEMFANSQGWKCFIEEITKWRDSAEKGWSTVETDRDFFIMKGNLQTLNYITNFEGVVRNHLADAARENDADV